MPASSILLLLLAFGVSVMVVAFLFQLRMRRETEAQAAARNDLRMAAVEARVKAESQSGRISRLETELTEARSLHSVAIEEQARLRAQLGGMQAALEAERRQSDEKLALLTEAREQLTHQFRSLANDILEEKSRRFTEQNQTNLGQLLEPLKSRIHEFQTRVDQVYAQEGKDRSALAQQVKQLMDLNRKLSDDAGDLTRALKGSSKTQGNWGEVVLERILESSGLRKGHEYEVQTSYAREDGSRAQPDVIVHLPEDRHIIIDAKVSLVDYNEHCNGETDLLREAAASRHLASVRAHIKGLSARNYQSLGLTSLDFVIMFVPVEPAFMLAISQDANLWTQAWERNVLLVSPSTLLFVVRTVGHLWRQEAQTQNARDIASRGAELYDKLSAFVSDLTKIGDRLSQARESYDAALSKLTRGRGNVIRQAEMLRKLGLQPTKSLPAHLVQGALEETAFDDSGDPAIDELELM
ncbi:MAG: DNA recombination protein RmuC [Acidobacteriaceae bacterium]